MLNRCGTCTLGWLRHAVRGIRVGHVALCLLLFSAWSAQTWAQCTGCTTATVGGDTVHTWTGNGNFTPPPGVTSVQVLVVGGGGGGGFPIDRTGGGGGAGGLIYNAAFAVAGTVTVTVGGGGNGGTSGSGATAGGNSVFGSLTAVGGGRGGTGPGSGGVYATAGGSGGGGYHNPSDSGKAGTAGQGNAGGTGYDSTNTSVGFKGGGGGGAGGAGTTATPTVDGTGGAGLQNSISGAALFYAGGGGGGKQVYTGTVNGGSGVGGNAGSNGTAGSAGMANRGGGGGGGSQNITTSATGAGGAGGSGIVIVRYPTPPPTYYSRVTTGNWSANATWSNAGCNGAAATSIPGATNDVVICNGHTITVNATAAARSVTLQTGNNAVNLTHNAGVSLTVGAGGVTLDGGTGGNQTKAWNINAGSATINGPVTLNGGNNNNRITRINLTTGTLDINGNLTMTADNNVRAVIAATGAANIFLSGDFTFNNGTLTPGPSSTFTYDGGAQALRPTAATVEYHHLVIAGTGTKTTSGAVAVGGNLTVQSGTGVNFSNTTTVTGTTGVSGALTLSGTNAKTFTGATTINSGGALNITATASSRTFTGEVTINNGGTWDNSANATVTMGNSLTNNGTFNSGTGAYTFQTTAGAVWAGSSGLDFAGAVVVNANRTNNTTTSVTGDLSGSATLTNAAGQLLQIGGNATITGLTATAANNTVEYNGTGAQTVKVTNYVNLTINKPANTATTTGGTVNVAGTLDVQQGTLSLNTSTIVANGPTTISGTLLIGSTTGTKTFNGNVTINNGGTWNHTVNSAVALNGNLANNGTFTANGGAAAIYTFGGGSAQIITGTASGTTTIPRVTLNNANGLSLTGTHDLTVSTQLTLTSGRITTNANVLFVSYTTGNGAIAGAGANDFVVGNLRKAYTAGSTQTRAFEVGTVAGGVRYAPVGVTLVVPTGAANAGNFTVSSTAGDHPNIGASTLDGSHSINRYWTLTNNSVNFNAAAGNSIAFTYVAADHDAGTDFNNFYVGRYNAPNWTEVTPSARSATTTTISGAGITTATVAGDYQIAERGVPLTLVSATALCGATTQVEVLFSAPVTAATAQNVANYALSGGATISAAVLDGGGQIVTLTTSTLTSGQNYMLTVNNVTAVSGGTVPANSQATFFTEGGYQSGLLGNYFLGMTLAGTPVQRIDGPVDFNWAAGTPGVPGIGADNFSVRWEGFVTPPVTGNYTFRTRSDDGVRLYVNGNPVINNWTDHAAVDNDSAVVALTAGQRYPIIMEFYENGGDAVAQLSWSGPGTGGFQFIPRANLSHFCGVAGPVAFYKLDETTWSGSGAVEDSSGNGFNGTAMNGAAPVPAQVCNGAQLNGTDRYIQVNGLSNLLNATASLAFWIRTSQTGNDTAWQAPGVTGVELSGAADDIFWGFLDGIGRIGIVKGDNPVLKSTVQINTGTWRHVVLTRDSSSGAAKVYIDGALNASGTIGTGIVGTPFSSLGRIDVSGTGTPQYLNGQLDEVRIYDRVLTDAEVVGIRDITRPCAVVFSHIRIEHTGLGLTCEPATVTVKACADADCTTLYPGAVSTVLSPTGWEGGNTVSFTGSTMAYLRRTTPGTVTMGASTTSPAPSSATLCFNGLTQTCSLDFQDTGFIFSTIPPQIAGTATGSHTLRAIKTDPATGVCTGLFNGNVNIDLASQCVNPATCAGQQVTINSAPAIAANPGAGVSAWTINKSMNFGANSTASFTLNYPDVGAIRLHARHNIAGSGDYMTGVSNDFVVKPAGFTVTNIRRTADNFANPGATDAGGTVFIKAGENITLTATAVNSSGNPTPNYGKETPAQGVLLTSALVTGLGLTSAPGLGNNTIAGGLFGVNPTPAGSATVTNVTWGEVGIITITPSVGGGSYLGAGDVTGTTTGNIGRFTPHHFDAGANTPMFTTACPASAGVFTYLGQPFNYASGMQPVLTVTARNLLGGTTQNYKGSFFKITNGTLTGKAYTAATGTLDISAITGPDPAIVDSGNGSATLTFNSGTGLSFVRSTLQAPFDAEISLAISVADTDGVIYSTNPARFGQASAGNGIAFSGAKTMRFGRLRLIGASGSQLLPLRVPFEAQYWTGTFFATNTADTCTTITNGNVGLGNYIGMTSATVNNVSALTAGRGQITLNPPGAGNNGSVDLAVKLGSSPAVCSTFDPALTGSGDLPWLRGQWCGGAYDKDPAARVRFGIRSGGDEQIYIRENY